jgi:hypothetical protein
MTKFEHNQGGKFFLGVGKLLKEVKGLFNVGQTIHKPL